MPTTSPQLLKAIKVLSKMKPEERRRTLDKAIVRRAETKKATEAKGKNS